METMQTQQLTRRFISFTRYSSLIVMTIGLLAIGSWIFNIPSLMSVPPGFQTMKMNTAIACLLAGIALWVASQEFPKPSALRVAQICKVIVFLIGLITLSEYVFGWNAGIDQLIVKDLQSQQGEFPGRMAFATALCFSMMGVASISIDSRARKIMKMGQYLMVAVLAISLLTLVGYVYDVQALYELGPYSSMAVHTAASMALISLGTLSLRANRGWLKIISTDTAGGLVLRRLLPIVLSIPILVGWLVVLGDRAGLYEANFGLAMISVLTAVLLIIILWLISRQLNRIDADRKRAAEEIAYQANLLANVSDAIVASNAQFRLTAWNAAAEEMYGWRADEVLGRKGMDVLQTEFLDVDGEEMRHRIAEIGKWQGEAIQRHKDGTPIAVEVSSIVMHDAKGEITGYLSVNRDIIERKRVEEQIRTLNAELEQHVAERTAELSVSEARFRGLFEHAPVSIWEEDFSAVRQYIDDLSADGIVDFSAYFDAHPEAINECAARVKIVDVNLATLKMFQAESKTQLLADLSKVLGPESLIPFKEELLTLARGETSFENETTNYTLRGERRTIFLRLTIAPGSEQTWDKVFVGISDITERRQAEAALAAERNLLQALMDNIPDTIYFKDRDSRFIRINRAQVKVLGVSTAEEANGKTDSDFFQNSELVQSFHDEEKRIIETGKALTNRIEFNPTREGKPRWFSATKVPVLDPMGEVIGIVGVSRDITEQKQAEAALSQSEERFRLMAWATKDAVWDWDLQTGRIWWGVGLQKIFHYPSETLETDSEWWRDRIHPQDRAKVDRTLNQALEGGLEFWSKEYRFQRVDGTYADIMDRAYIIRDSDGKPYRMVGAMMDVTERKQMESTLLQSNEKLGQFLEELQQRNREAALLNELSHMLQGCQSAREAYGVIAELSKQLFPHTAGAIYMLNGSLTQISAISSWGASLSTSNTFSSDHCRALRRSATRPLNADQPGMCCLNFAQQPGITYCLPIQVQGETLGIFHLQSTSEENLPENKRQLAYTVVEQSEMALSNLKLREALLEQSIRDPLTELYNRRYMEEALNQQLSRVTRQLHPLGLIMIDIDHFKDFNDTHGHAAGDTLLRELGKLLQSHIRGGDVACRYGGEEFLLIMPDASLEAAHQRAVLLQEEAKKLRVRDAGQALDGITLSLGVAIYPEHGRSIDSVLRAADAALYRAKQEGRDRVVVAERAY